MVVTEAEAREIRDALLALEQKEQQEALTQFNADLAVAQTWWDTVKPAIPTTRDEAVTVFRQIEALLKTETDRFRLIILKQNLELANEKFKELKALGT